MKEAGHLCQILDGFMELQVDNNNDAEWHCDVAEHCAEHCGDAEYNVESVELPVEYYSENAFLMRKKEVAADIEAVIAANSRSLSLRYASVSPNLTMPSLLELISSTASRARAGRCGDRE